RHLAARSPRQGRFRWWRQAHGRRFDRGAAAQGVLPGAVVDRTGVSALQAGLGERRPDRRDVCATEAGEAAVSARGSPRPSQEVQDAYGRRPREVSCLMAIQLPKQPSDRLNVPEPVFPDNCPTAVRVMPFPAPTECNVPSGSTCPLPPLTIIFPLTILAGNVPVYRQPALVNVHAPSKALLFCSGAEPGGTSAGRAASSRGSDRNEVL